MTTLKLTLRDWRQMTSVAVTSVPDGRLTILKALQVPTALRSKPSLSDCRDLLFTSSLARWGNWTWGADTLSLRAESRLRSRFGGGAEASEFNL